MSQIEAIKKDIISTRTRILTDANKELINMYFRIGKIISENQKYVTNFINSLSTSLRIEFPDATGFSPRNLSRMKKFYETYKELSNLPPAVAKLPWTHNSILVERISDGNKRIWYAEKCIENGWDKVVLDHQIDLYENKFTSKMELAFLKSLMDMNFTTESQRKRLIQRFVKKVVVYNGKIDVYLIAGVDTLDSNDEVKDIVELDDKNKEKLYLGNGCLILECGL